MKNTWFRLYNEIINDPKVLVFDECQRWRYVAVLCLHSNGQLVGRPDDEIALALRITVEEWQKTRDILKTRKLLEEDLKPHGWDKRQYLSDVKDPTAAERQRRYRNAKRDKTVTSRGSNGEVTLEADEVKQQYQVDRKYDRNGAVTSRLPEQIQIRTEQNRADICSGEQTEQTEVKNERSRRKTRISDNWQPDAKNIELCHKHGRDPEREKAEFISYWQGRGDTRADWQATFRNRVLSLERYANSKPASVSSKRTTVNEGASYGDKLMRASAAADEILKTRFPDSF